MNSNASVTGVGTRKIRRLVASRRNDPQTRVRHAEVIVAAEQRVEPRTDRGVMRMVIAVRGQNNVDVEKQHGSTALIEFEMFVQRFQNGASRRQVESRGAVPCLP